MVGRRPCRRLCTRWVVLMKPPCMQRSRLTKIAHCSSSHGNLCPFWIEIAFPMAALIMILFNAHCHRNGDYLHIVCALMEKKKKLQEPSGKWGEWRCGGRGGGGWGTRRIFGNWHKAHQRMQTTRVGGLQLVVMTGAERK